MPPANLSALVWYFAYGSNMNERLFRERRHMTPIETRIGVLYRLPLRKFARLDNSEDKQYSYLWTDIEDQAGNRLPAVTYRVRRSLGAQGKPGKQYIDASNILTWFLF